MGAQQETLKAGDEVLSRNEDTGATECKAIMRTYVHDADDVARLSISFDDGRVQSFDVTLGHPFWVADKGWTSVRDLVPGDALATAARTERVVVDGWVAETGTERVFNLEVEGDHSYFVGADGVWVHNMCGGKPPYRPNPAHTPGNPGFNPGKTIEPRDSLPVYQSSIDGNNGKYYGLGGNGEIYRYSSDNAGGYHFTGMTGGRNGISPNNIPIAVRRALGW